ncbi:nucleic acid/nucleotide deaminase domain-containing protein [Streptomyces macrosporus]|uniref:Outer membrane channel protein CpnT-like N-terminal domain-containing protein n=1 Tax=Streptomyces macrosporus TaxID=44032 RepID=A0ABN3K800_9ACTN
MAIELPDEVREVLDFIGIDWPDINEDELRDTASEYREFAKELRDTITKANRACSHVTAGKSKGQAVDAFRQRWGTVSGQDMKKLADAVDVLAGVMDTGADYVVACKLAIIANVTTTIATATGGVIGAIFTGGLSALLSAAAIAALKQLVKEVIDLLISQLVELATEKIEGKVMGLLEGLFDGGTGSGGKDGNGNLLPEGSDALGQELWIEFAEFEDAIAELGEEHKRFTDKKNDFTGKRQKRSMVGKKDGRFAKFGAAIDKAEEKIELSAHKMSKELEKNVDGLDTTKRSNDKNEKDTKEKFDKEHCDGDDDVPMYLLNADGTVVRLHPDGTSTPVGGNDQSGIREIMTEPGQKPGEAGRVWRPRDRENHPFGVSPSKDTKRVQSERVDPGSTDLSRATQIARYHNQDWGGGNYAAGRYVSDSGKEIIIVGNSEGPHSERTIGYPLLKAGKQDNLTELYTERQPCQGRPSWCDKWTAKHFGEDLQVTHSQKYDNSESRKTRDTEHAEYREWLEKQQKKHGVTGGFK